MTLTLDNLETPTLTDQSKQSRIDFNNPLHEHTRHGICCNCNTRFTWTGSIPEVPDCRCGRRHTEEDFKKYLTDVLGKDKGETDIVKHQRHLERQDNAKRRPRNKSK